MCVFVCMKSCVSESAFVKASVRDEGGARKKEVNICVCAYARNRVSETKMFFCMRASECMSAHARLCACDGDAVKRFNPLF